MCKITCFLHFEHRYLAIYAVKISKIYSKVEAPVVDHLSNFRADGEEYEVMENFAV